MKKLLITLLLFCFYVAQGAHGAMIIQQFTSGGSETLWASNETGSSAYSLSASGAHCQEVAAVNGKNMTAYAFNVITVNGSGGAYTVYVDDDVDLSDATNTTVTGTINSTGWHKITLDTPYAMSTGSIYVALRANGVAYGDRLIFNYENGGSVYAGGDASSADSGSDLDFTGELDADHDLHFRVYHD